MNMRKHAVTGIIAAVTLFLGGSWTTIAAPEQQPAPPRQSIHEPDLVTVSTLEAEDLFPAMPGDEWVYVVDGLSEETTLVLNDPAVINGVATSVFENSDRTREYYTADSNGIQLHALFAPRVFVSGLGRVNLTITFIPPIKIGNGVLQVGDVIQSSGIGRTNRLPRVGVVDLSYAATFSVTALDTVTVPAGTFDVVRVAGSIIISGAAADVITINFDLAEQVGRVKGVLAFLGVTETSELVSYRVGVHDLAVTKIIAPKTVTLNSRFPFQTKQVKVEIQNRSRHSETIEDMNVLASLVGLTVESLGSGCPNIVPELHLGRPQKSLPLTVKPKQKFSVIFDVTYDCANDPAKSSPRDPGHEDFRYTAVVNHAALDGEADVHLADDICPRDLEPPGVDPNPDGTIKDPGCGNRKPDRTLGADILTDVIFK
jgi:hypothetical protein